MTRGVSDETQNHHKGEEEEEKRFSSSHSSPLVVKERCFDFTISGRKDDGDLAETTTWDIPCGVDFHEWQRASALAKKDFERKEKEKCKNEIFAEEKEERKSVVPRLSRPPHRVLETLEEEEEEEEVWAKEEAVEEVLKDKRRHEDDAIQEKKKTIEDEKTMLREKLRKEKMKNRVMERNVKAEAVALARRILAEEKRRTETARAKKKMMGGEAKSSAVQLHEVNDEKKKSMSKASTRIDFEKRYSERTEEMKQRKEGRRSIVSDVSDDVERESNKKKPEWNDSFATERFERFPDAPVRSPVTVEELRRREKEKRKEALHKPFSHSSAHILSTAKNTARKSRSSTSSSSSLTSVVNSRRIFG